MWTLSEEACEAADPEEAIASADRSRSASLPLRVYATNGKGYSEPLDVRLPWSSAFSWLSEAPCCLATCGPPECPMRRRQAVRGRME
ncbi:unnamed protein product [Prorocentrum cordatum]|uniref:Uncharacterized protein n=1 Tax=Prorocentrum cordatum TaxID=2364126 RepID=A0ABN9XWV9_9DINO|nr:unnamed protein product [Polarella glacialis]